MAITPEMDAKIKEYVAKSELQKSMDEMLETGQYRLYVKQAKLELLFGEKGRDMDNLLKLGYLKGYDPIFAGF
jgi:hypothetical protein